MSGRDPRADWAAFRPEEIPTKHEFPELESFLIEAGPGGRLLDLGCGNGRLSHMLADRGYEVTGVDINERAIAAAARGNITFLVRDIVARDGLQLPPGFRIVVCQLVLSVVGGPAERQALLSNAFNALIPGGLLYISASGVSSDLNANYAELYERDFPQTGEQHTYFSRDGNDNVLYTTHHFSEEELIALCNSTGFEIAKLVQRVETSSRRSGEAARFFYIACRKR